MMNRIRGWWQLWVTLAVMWTFAVFSYGWVNLPRAQYMPHSPQLQSQLSDESASILRVNHPDEKPVRGALAWSEEPRMVRMPNGAPLMFPAATTDERAAIVASEYLQLLNAEADKLRWPYVLELLMLWLAPLLVAAVVIRGIGTKTDSGAAATRADHPASMSF